jgi:hypothetical protein
MSKHTCPVIAYELSPEGPGGGGGSPDHTLAGISQLNVFFLGGSGSQYLPHPEGIFELARDCVGGHRVGVRRWL